MVRDDTGRDGLTFAQVRTAGRRGARDHPAQRTARVVPSAPSWTLRAERSQIDVFKGRFGGRVGGSKNIL